jgi:two-component system, OmpR family, sensor histidine kinase KdpD
MARSFAEFDRGPRRAAISFIVVVVVLVIGGIVIAALEALGVADASPTFLLAVVAVAVLRGTWPAVLTAVGAFLAYDFFFIQPLYTFTVRDPEEWLNLLLLFVVGIVVGQLAGSSRARAEAALEGERSARAMFDLSYTLSTRRDTPSALRPLAEIVRTEANADRVWISVGDSVQADTGWEVGPPGSPAVHVVLRRRPGDEPAEWVRVHAGQIRGGRNPADGDTIVYRVAITGAGQSFGSLWVRRRKGLGEPDVGETQVMAAAADQIGTALERDRLLRDATAAEISRRSEALKSALLDSVSHDLRTPLASIRAAAGTLMDREVDWPAEQRYAIAASIDREAEWLNRLVTNLLDMSRIEAGELRPNLAPFELEDIVRDVLGRGAAANLERPVEVDIAPDVPPVLVDEVFLGQVLANVLDNAAKYAGPAAWIRLSAHRTGTGQVLVTVEDDGPGAPADALPRLFEKFYRVPRKGEGSRRGTGIGLAVVRGLVDSMGGQVNARSSELGGLAVDIELAEAPSGPGMDEGSRPGRVAAEGPVAAEGTIKDPVA